MIYNVQNFVEPSKVRMIWQSNLPQYRSKYFVAELIRCGSEISLFYNRNSIEWLGATSAGFRGFPAFDTRQIAHHSNVMQVLSRRLPPRSRSDFYYFLEKNGLSQNPMISEFALLGYTGARLPGDGFSFEIDFSIEQMPFEFFFEISGFRYNAGMQMDMAQLTGKPVLFLPEPHNPHDPNAVGVYVDQSRIGYVPRTLAPLLNGWLQYAVVHAAIGKIEGPAVRPDVSVFISLATAQGVLPSIAQ